MSALDPLDELAWEAAEHLTMCAVYAASGEPSLAAYRAWRAEACRRAGLELIG